MRIRVARLGCTPPSLIPGLCQGDGTGFGDLKVFGVGVGVVHKDHYHEFIFRTSSAACLSKQTPGRGRGGREGLIHTVLRNFKPYTVLVESVLIRIKPLQLPSTLWCLLFAIIHRCILLVAKDNSLARPTFATALATLGADWSLFVTW